MAEILGKAMRLGAMMWVNKKQTNAKLFWAGMPKPCSWFWKAML